MSLHSLAHHLQSAGRGEDKVLVHMTPREVGGLQALAQAHGGSLTVNPKTGLPEAGFLSSLLPMIAGFALAPLTAGTSLAFLGTPLGAAALVGGGTALATGSLGKGLMAGLGAYGGAGLGAGLANTGATQLANAQYAPQGAQWAQVSKNIANFNPSSAIYNATETAAKNAVKDVASNAVAGAVDSAAGAINPAYNAPAFNAQGVYNPLGEVSKSAMYAPPPVTTAPAVSTAMPGSEAILKSPMLTQGTSAAVAPTYASPIASSATSTGLPAAPSMMDKLGAGFRHATSGWEGLKEAYEAAGAAAPYSTAATLGSTALGNYYDKKEEMADAAAAAAKKNQGMIRPYEFSREVNQGAFDTGAPIWSSTPGSSAEKLYFTDTFTPLTPYKAPGPEYKAEGGITSLALGGPVETMSAENAVGGNLMYPQANINTPIYSNPAVQRPEAVNIIAPTVDAGVGAYSGEQKFAIGGELRAPKVVGDYKYSYNPETSSFTQTAAPHYDTSGVGTLTKLFANQTPKGVTPVGTVSGGVAAPVGGSQTARPMMAQPVFQQPPVQPYQSPEQQLGLGGFYDNMNAQLGMMGYAGGGDIGLGAYSDGGRLLKGPGDGVSDSIPAVIGNRQPARLADGEFVVPARIVSELGNGSTEAGAKRLYAMMDRVQKARRKTVGKDKVAANTNADKYLPA